MFSNELKVEKHKERIELAIKFCFFFSEKGK